MAKMKWEKRNKDKIMSSHGVEYTPTISDTRFSKGTRIAISEHSNGAKRK
jgi:hypothetical protein